LFDFDDTPRRHAGADPQRLREVRIVAPPTVDGPWADAEATRKLTLADQIERMGRRGGTAASDVWTTFRTTSLNRHLA
jgi:hypothetical protein